jgi:hypothetical protein
MALAQLLPSRVRNYRTTIITNTNVRSGEEVERKIDAGDVTEVDRPLGVAYPAARSIGRFWHSSRLHRASR